jgi:hypothetical protein
MPFFLMKIKHLMYSLSIGVIFTFCSACETSSSNASEATKQQEIVAEKTVKAVTYFDYGAVVPSPNTREVTFTVEDSTKIFLTYKQSRVDKDSLAPKMMLSDAARREELYDNILELVELPDGIDIKPGKQPCVGGRGIDISVVFNNGDTSRFSITGAARCDKSLCPSFWTIDSLANILITN